MRRILCKGGLQRREPNRILEREKNTKEKKKRQVLASSCCLCTHGVEVEAQV